MKAAGLNEIPPDVWKTRKFYIVIWYYNAVYNQITIDRWTKGCILPVPKKGDFRIVKNYLSKALTSIAAKVYNALLLNRIKPEIEKILGKNQDGFRSNRSKASQIVTIHRILGVHAKKRRNDTLTCIFL